MLVSLEQGTSTESLKYTSGSCAFGTNRMAIVLLDAASSGFPGVPVRRPPAPLLLMLLCLSSPTISTWEGPFECKEHRVWFKPILIWRFISNGLVNSCRHFFFFWNYSFKCILKTSPILAPIPLTFLQRGFFERGKDVSSWQVGNCTLGRMMGLVLNWQQQILGEKKIYAVC